MEQRKVQSHCKSSRLPQWIKRYAGFVSEMDSSAKQMLVPAPGKPPISAPEASRASPMTRTQQPMRGVMILFVRASVGVVTRAWL